jgi:TM2 domain-containing membrane protein YozV
MLMVTSTTSKKIIAIILTILIWGLGHVYIRRIKRGIGLFFLGLAIMLGASFVIPFPFSLLVGLGYVAWLIYDVLRIINLQNEQLTQTQRADYHSSVNNLACKKCGSMNKGDSSYCVNCSSALR